MNLHLSLIEKVCIYPELILFVLRFIILWGFHILQSLRNLFLNLQSLFYF